MSINKSISMDDIHSSTYCVLARNKASGEIRGIGTAFCIAVFNNAALLLTAGHNIDEIHKLEKPHSSPNISKFFDQNPKSTKVNDIFILLKDEQGIHECKLFEMTSWRAYDTAVLWVILPESNCAKVKWGIDTQLPKIGANVGLIGFDKVEYGSDKILKMGLKTSVGKVLNIIQGEDAMSKADCLAIRTDIPLNSGFSGAPLFDLDTGCVIGIASRDSSESSSSSAGMGTYSQCVAIIHALGIVVPKTVKIPELEVLEKWKEKPFKTLFHLVALNSISDKSECHQKIELKGIKENGLAANFKWSSH
jgi:hypothetical protein